MRAHVAVLLTIILLLQSLLTPLVEAHSLQGPHSAYAGQEGSKDTPRASSENKMTAAGIGGSPQPEIRKPGADSNARSAPSPGVERATAGMFFEENQGQTDPAVRFMARTGGGTVFFASNELVFSIPPPRPGSSEKAGERHNGRRQPAAEKGEQPKRERPSVARLQFVGAELKPAVLPGAQLPGRTNYFRGQDAANWQLDVPTYAGITYKALYPGVDLAY